MFGKVRVRPPCTKEILRALDPQAPDDIIDLSLRVVQSINFDDDYFEDVALFGSDIQSGHSRITEEGLQIARDEVFEKGQATLTGLLVLFEKLNPENVFPTKKTGLKSVLANLFVSTEGARQLLADLYPQMTAHASTLKALDVPLKELSNRITELEKLGLSLKKKIAVSDLSVKFLIDHLRNGKHSDETLIQHYASQADIFERRMASLLGTRLTLDTGSITLGMLKINVQDLLASGQDMLELDLPAWHTAYTTAIVASRSANETEQSLITSLFEIHTRIVNKLKTKRK
jgi:hypothetical protein